MPASHPFFTAVEWGAGLGIVQGFAGGRFAPLSVVTRMAASAFLYRDRHVVWSPPRQLSTASVDEYLGDLVSVADDAGHIHVLWKEDDVLLYRKVDANGDTIVGELALPFTPVANRAYTLSHPALAPLPGGGVAVFWRYGASNLSTGTGIFGATLDGSGRVVVEPRLVRAGHFAYLSADADAAGRIQLAAQQVRATTSGSSSIVDQIVHVTLDSELDPVTAWAPLSDRRASNAASYPNLTVGPDGVTHVVWLDSRRNPGTTEWDLYYSRVEPDGTVSVDQFPLAAVDNVFHNDGSPPGTWGPALDVDPDGDLAVAYLGDHDEVYLATVAADGAAGLRGVALDLGPFTGATRSRGIAVRAERRAVSVLVPSGGDLAKLVEVRTDLTGAVLSPARAIPLGDDAWVRASLTHVGSGIQAVLTHDLGTTFDRVAFTATTAAGRPVDVADLVVDDAHSVDVSTPSPPREGTVVQATVRVVNAGGAAAPPSTAAVSYDGSPIATVAVPGLGVEESAPVTASWTVPADMAFDPAALDVVVDPADVIAERSESNNQVEHLVDLWLRPAGARLAVKGLDETEDPTRAGIEPVLGFGFDLTGVTADGDPFSVTGSAGPHSHVGFLSTVVPPGAYTLHAHVDGHADPAPVAVTVTRDPVDPYVITVDPPTPTLWFNRWGAISGTVVAAGTGEGIVGAVVTEREQGRSTVTGAGGAFSFDTLAAGVHRLDVEADGRARLVAHQVVVPIGAPPATVLTMDTTDDAYLDVVATSELGGGLPFTTVELLDPTGTTVLDTCPSDGLGRCSFHPDGGVSYRVRASHVGYTTTTSAAFALVAGRTHVEQVELPLVVGATNEVSSGMLAWSSWADSFSIPFGADELLFYGNYALDVGVRYQDVGVDRYVRSLEVAMKGNPWSLQILMDVPQTGGPWPMPFLLVIPSVSEERTNVRLDGLRLVNRVTGQLYWSAPPQSVAEPPFLYSHTLDGETNERGWLPDQPVDWNNLVVELDVAVGMAVPGEDGAAGWQASSLLYGSSLRSTITWQPSTDESTIGGRRV